MPEQDVLDPNWDDVHHVIEIQGVYDGWSVAVMRDGEMKNRWRPGTLRHAMTEEYIDQHEGRVEVENG